MKHHVILNTLDKFKRERKDILDFDPDAKIWSVEETARRNPPAYHMHHCPCGHGTWGPLDEKPDNTWCNMFCARVGEARMFLFRLHPSGDKVD